MIDEAPSVDFQEFRPGDPYDIELPDGWAAQYRDRTAVYENDRGDHRVRIVGFTKGLTLYWWVDVYVGEGEWHRQEVGLGDSYTEPEAAAATVGSYLEGARPEADAPDPAMTDGDGSEITEDTDGGNEAANVADNDENVVKTDENDADRSE